MLKQMTMSEMERFHLDNLSSKKFKNEDDNEELLTFLKWSKANRLILSSKVRVSRQGSCAQYGMVAVADISEGDQLFEIPRSLLLTPETSNIAAILHKENKSIRSKSGWVPLLLALMHEYTSPNSNWKPYVSLVPDFEQLELPMFWSREERLKELGSTGVVERIDKDLASITEEFSDIALPFIKRHPDSFPLECQDIEFYKKMVAFVMAYSFTEPESDKVVQGSQPMMVPMADILNHVAKNNAHLNFGKESLKMVAIRAIKKGEEVFNTYGEVSNGDLLHMYGFAEAYPDNHNDTVEIPFENIYKYLIDESEGPSRKLVEEKWTFLKETDLIEEDGAFVFGMDGFLTEEEVYNILKVMCMTEEEFTDYKEAVWSESEDEAVDSLANSDICKLSRASKEILIRIVDGCVGEYDRILEEEEESLQPEKWRELTRRQQFSLHVRHGQLKLFHKLKELCNS